MTNQNRPRSTGIWVGAALMVLAVLLVVGAVVFFWQSLTGDSEVVAADGSAHEVTLPADEDYGLFADSFDQPPSCELTDGAGNAVDLDRVSGSYEVNNWTAVRSFQTGDGDLTITCAQVDTGEDTDVRLGPLPSVGTLVAVMLGGIGLGALCGLGGLVLLIVTIVRRNRGPRH